MWRVSRNTDADVFTQTGQRLARAMMGAARDHAQLGDRIRDVLDWGCGCGRVARWIAAEHPEVRLCGCDIDAEAVGWCSGNIPGEFAVSPLYPPLPYPDGSFDAVLACSVMTHLARRFQRKWLADIARVLRPGGVLVASVHGEAAARAFGVTDLAATGIQDRWLDTALAGVAPDGYYRTVLQGEAYTRSAWADWFEIAAYEESALEQHDLAVCRKPRRSGRPEPREPAPG